MGDHWHAVMALATVLAIPIAANAGEPASTHFTIACPAVWPGSDAPGAQLHWGDVWTDYEGQLEPAGGGALPPGLSKVVQMDCAYSKYKAYPRHITINVPGHVSMCRIKAHGEKAEALTCETQPDADGTMGPVVMQIAEPVTLATQLNGFRLRQTPEAIRKQADASGYMAAGDGHLLRLSHDQERVEVTFSKATGLSRLVAIIVPQNRATGIAPPVIMRFGVFGSLVFTDSSLGWSDRQWTTPGQPAIVRYHPFDNAPTGTLSLIDTATPE